METPVSAFRKVCDGQNAFLLESVEGGERIARFSFLGTSPYLIVRTKGQSVQLEKQDGTQEEFDLLQDQDPLGLLKDQMQGVKWVSDPTLPRFCGGAVGYIGYDMIRFFERLPDTTEDDLNLPDSIFALTDSLLIFDHVKHKIRVLANARINGNPDAAYNAAIRKIDHLVSKLSTPIGMQYAAQKPHTPINQPSSNFTQREDFEKSVEQCKEYIAAGDVIQVVLSQRFSQKVTADPFDIYRALRSVNPSPYMYYLSFGNIKLIGSSPEILVTAQEGTVTTRPIAGTRPRGKTDEEDTQLIEDLLADAKERAEHIMLVDLGRNDLGRVCDYGSVRVDELMAIERYSHVMHIVSNVRGQLRQDKDQFDVLRAAFPAGTVSGAPKVRAMQIIDELEPTRRGTYAGAIGYFSYSGDMDTCITIRTILIHNDTAYIQAGAGIVADSIPAMEYQETINKASAMLKAIEMAESGLQ
jgi:anthranilate synthase component 1